MRRVLYRSLNRYVHVVMLALALTLCLYVVIMSRVTLSTRLPIANAGAFGLVAMDSASRAQRRTVSMVSTVSGRGQFHGRVETAAAANSSSLLAGVPRASIGYLTIGIPTLRRPKGEYFFSTLASLFKQSTPTQQRNMTIVAMMADRDPAFNDLLVKSIKEKYDQQLREGLLLLVSAPNTEHLFLDDNLKLTFNDSLQRVRWRSKQNLDYAALMEFSTSLSTYYLQLEDDVTAAPNYIQHIQDFVRANAHRAWAGLEVCPHGFIGKLFRSADLPKLVAILRTFYLEMPCDFLIDHFYRLMLQTRVIRRRGTLFFHQGKYSSLGNVTRKTDRTDRGFMMREPGEPLALRRNRGHQNPAARLFTSMTVYRNYFLRHAYRLDSGLFFWAKDVKDGDYVTVVFNEPQRLEKIIVESGLPRGTRRGSDSIRNATVEVGERAYIGSQDSKAVCTDTHDLGDFRDGRFEKSLNASADVKCVTIVITQAQREWVAIREIVVFLK